MVCCTDLRCKVVGGLEASIAGRARQLALLAGHAGRRDAGDDLALEDGVEDQRRGGGNECCCKGQATLNETKELT